VQLFLHADEEEEWKRTSCVLVKKNEKEVARAYLNVGLKND